MRNILIRFMFALWTMATCWAQGNVPVISDIQSIGLTHSSIRFTFKVNPGGNFVQIRYGVQPGSYPYRSAAYRVNGGDPVSIGIGGLAPATTYYFRMTAQPSDTSSANLCATDSCGSVEQIVVTPAVEATLHPELPETPRKLYEPAPPQTAGYALVPMKVHTDGTCVAAATVGEVQINDSLRQVLQRVAYGTIVEFPQGAECKVFGSGPPFEIGVQLPSKPLDPLANGNINSPLHRWIVLRTASAQITDFPPPGVRITPKAAPKLAKLIAQQPASNRSYGQIFDSGGSAPHHFWIETLEFTHRMDNVLYPLSAVDPMPFGYLLYLRAADNEPLDQYIVFDRIYLHGHGAPGRLQYGMNMAGANIALMNSHIDKIDYWRLAGYPTQRPASSGNTITFPVSSFKRRNSDPAIAMSAPSIVSSTADGAVSGDWAAFLGIGSNNLTIQYEKRGSGSLNLSCSNCSVSQIGTISPPPDAFLWARGSFGSTGSFNVSFAAGAEDETSAHGYLSAGVQLDDAGTGPYKLDNNFIEAYGLGFYVDAGGHPTRSNDDVLFTHSYMFWNQDHRWTANNWNGYRYQVRQHFETKRGKRWIVKGNIFDGNFSYQNTGPSIFLSGRSIYTLDGPVTGVTDYLLQSNTIRHAASGWQCMGSSTPPPDPEVSARVLFQNNLLYDLNRLVYDQNGPSFWSGYTTIFPGCQDVIMRKNTMGLILGRLPGLLLLGGGGALGEGFVFEDNLLYMSQGEIPGPVAVDDSQVTPALPRIPAVDFTGTPKARLDSYFVRTAATITPSYEFRNNVIIGGKVGFQLNNLRDMTQGELNTLAAGFPPNNHFPSGSTMKAREDAAGLDNPDIWNLRLKDTSPHFRGGSKMARDGDSIGVDYDTLEAEQGRVRSISAEAGVDTIIFRYTAPDTRACSVETSGPNGFWNRISDNGGHRGREVVIEGLSQKTVYEFRIYCYFPQVNDGVVNNEFRLDEITEGVVETQESTTQASSQTLSFNSPVVLGATQVVVEYGPTQALANTTNPVSCLENCQVNLPGTKGRILYYRHRYLNSENVEVGRGQIRKLIQR